MLFSVMDAIHERRSIRAYRPEQITDGQLKEILEAGLAAPSAMNSQAWHFTAVQDEALLNRVNEATRKGFIKNAKDDEECKRFENPEWSVFYHAPTVIFISCIPLDKMRYAQTDAGIAVENMALAAVGLELGSVILGMPHEAFVGEEAEELRKALHFPEGFDFMIALAVGYPATGKDAHVVHPDRVTILK